MKSNSLIMLLVSLIILRGYSVYAGENKQADTAFREYAKSENLRYTIEELKVGAGKEDILITTDADYPDDPKLFSWGYPIRLYRYEDGEVIEFSGELPQSVSSGPWYLEYDVLYTIARRGGFLRLDIDSDYNCERIPEPQKFELEYGEPLQWEEQAERSIFLLGTIGQTAISVLAASCCNAVCEVGATQTVMEVYTFLWRYVGSPEPTSMAKFKDMTGNDDFNKAISWAAENGITTGWDDETFRPWNQCLRPRPLPLSFIGTHIYKK